MNKYLYLKPRNGSECNVYAPIPAKNKKKLPPIRILDVKKFPAYVIGANPDKYIDIFNSYQNGESTVSIAKRYDMNPNTVIDIIRRVYRRIRRHLALKYSAKRQKTLDKLFLLKYDPNSFEAKTGFVNDLPAMSTRAWNCLYRAGIRTPRELEYILELSENGADFLLGIRNCGRGTAEEILKACGLDKKYQISEKPKIKRVYVHDVKLILEEMREKENG